MAAPPLQHRVDEDGFLRIVFDTPGRRVNLLTGEVLKALAGLLDAARGADDVRGVMFESAKSGSFVAGMDLAQIAEVDDAFRAAEGARYGQAVLQRIAEFGRPTLCAIGGTCMGGGTELALACDMRVLTDDAALRIGLPEVRIGIIPGFGGTQRLPRLVGLPAALELIVSGRGIDPERALRIGLADAVVPREMLEAEALALLRRAVDEGVGAVVGSLRRRPPLHHRLVERAGPLRSRVLDSARRSAARRVDPDQYPAPFRAVEAVEASMRYELPQGLDIEARILGELVPTATSKNLIWLFGARNALRGQAPAAVPRRVRRIAVLGAGATGATLTGLAAARGLPVRLRDQDWETLLGAMRRIADGWAGEVRGDAEEIDRRMARIAPTTDDTGQVHADLVVEAIGDDLAMKQRLLAGVERRVAEHAVFATTSPSIPVSRIAAHALRPERVVGLHLIDGIGDSSLVEVVAGPYSSPEALATAHSVVVGLGRVPVIVGDGPGFLVERLMTTALDEALRLLAEGVAAEAIDRAMTAFGMEEGPFERADRIGIERARRIAVALHGACGERFSGGLRVLEALVEAGRTGRSSGRGFHRYRDGRKTGPDGALRGLLGGPTPRDLPAEMLQERLVLSIVNEAARCLENGVARQARDVDAALVLGAGFPAFRGGPLRFADATGVPGVADRLMRLAEAQGPRFEPTGLIERMVREQGRFHGRSRVM